MTLSRTATLRAVAALRKRGLIAMDGRNDTEAAEMIEREAATEDRTTRARDRNRAFPSARDAEEMERERMEDCRDAVRRAADDADFDPVAVIEALMQNASPEEMSEIMQACREVSTDHRGPRAWANDRREMRVSRDRMMTARARKFGAGRDAYGPPNVGEGYRDPERDIEQFAGNRNFEEVGHGTGEDRRRARAYDIALDGGDGNAAVAAWLGEQAASIGKI